MTELIDIFLEDGDIFYKIIYASIAIIPPLSFIQITKPQKPLVTVFASP